jgi:peptidase E
LSEIAEVLRPQRAIMFLPHENVSSNVLEWMREAQNRLSRNGIKAQIYALPTF